MQQLGVRFARIHGHIVPLVNRARQAVSTAAAVVKRNPAAAKQAAVFGVVGSIIGATAGEIPAAISNMSKHAELKRLLNQRQVNTKAFVKRHEKGVHVITNAKELQRSKALTDREKANLGSFMQSVEKGENAGAMKSRATGKYFVFARKRLNGGAVGHELGHIRQGKKGIPSPLGGTLSASSGYQYQHEADAWRRSPSKDYSAKKVALGTYKTRRNWTRIGAFLGAGLAGGVAFAGRMK